VLLLLMQQQQQQSPCNSNPRENSITQKLKKFASVFSNPMMISVFFFFPFFSKNYLKKKIIDFSYHNKFLLSALLSLPFPEPSQNNLTTFQQTNK
jgi:hypothetical protein